MFYCLIKNSSFVILILNCIFFHFILGNIVEGGVLVSTLPDQLLNQQPPIIELTTHARTSEYNQLGVILQLDSVNLAKCHDYTSMYQLWLEEKAQNATRRSLLDALTTIGLNDVASTYKDYLKTIVSYIVHISIYTCI